MGEVRRNRGRDSTCLRDRALPTLRSQGAGLDTTGRESLPGSNVCDERTGLGVTSTRRP